MAEARKCDRCKKYYDPHSWGSDYFLYDCGPSEKIDLCLDCTQELVKWIKNKETYVTRSN